MPHFHFRICSLRQLSLHGSFLYHKRKMHIVPYFIPGNHKACSMGAEYGIRRIFLILHGIIACAFQYRFRIMTGNIASKAAGQLSPSTAVCLQFLLIIGYTGRRDRPGDHCLSCFRMLQGKLRAAAVKICHSPAHQRFRDRQFKPVTGLQKKNLSPDISLHQPLPQRPVGGLSEISALCMLQMGFSCYQSNPHIRYRRSRQHPMLFPLLQMGQHQPLPVAVQLIRAHCRFKLQTASSWQGLQQQMDFCIMAQRLIMPYALYRGGNGLLIQNLSLTEPDLNPQSVPDQILQDLCLHLPHHLYLQFLQGFLPHQMKLRQFFFYLLKARKNRSYIHLFRKQDPVSQNGLQKGKKPALFHAQSLSRQSPFRPCYRTDHPCLCLRNRIISGSGIQPDLIHLFHTSGKHILYQKSASGDLKPGQTVALCISGDLKDPCPKVFGIWSFYPVLVQCFQQFIHACKL